MGRDTRRDFNFRILVFSGEPGAGVPSTKRRIEEIYGGICIDSGSTAEMTPWVSKGECAHRRGAPYGREGVPVYTPLERNSQPMIRFWAGDIALWVDDPCPCGRTYPRLPKGIYGRGGDLFVNPGQNR